MREWVKSWKKERSMRSPEVAKAEFVMYARKVGRGRVPPVWRRQRQRRTRRREDQGLPR